MDDGGHRENARHKAEQCKTGQGQWLVQPQPSMKQIMAIMAERDAAIHERNMAVSEKKAAIAERDMAFLQRDSAIAERNNAIMERDNAIATLQYRENSLANASMPCQPGCQIPRGTKHAHNQLQQSHINEASKDMQANDLISTSPEAGKSRKGKRAKDADRVVPPSKKSSKPLQKIKAESEEFGKAIIVKTHESVGGDDEDKQVVAYKTDWKGQDLGLNQVAFDETTMQPPVCSCTGSLRQCYKWGNGGWQSSCCTTSISCYPLPAVPNKRHARVGGRKMSGSAFSKLLSRLAAQGYDLSSPVDLKEHWAKHGTNRYITIK